MTKKGRRSLFDRLKTGLEEGIAHTKGELSLKTVEVPEAPPLIDGSTLAALREAAEMSQSVFARVLNVSAKTVQSWEQGVRTPSMASRRLIHVFSQRPEAVCEVVGVRPVTLRGVRIERAPDGKRRIVVAAIKGRSRKTESA